MVRLAGFEPTTPWFVAKYSIQLSYSRTAVYCNTFCTLDTIEQQLCKLVPTCTPSGWVTIIWWAHPDSNQGPKDSGLCGFHHSLDYAFIIFFIRT